MFTELRVQERPNHSRIPDLCVTLGDPPEQGVTHAPLIALEVLSPRDSLTGLSNCLDAYLAMGVRYIRVLEPSHREAYICSRDGFLPVDFPKTQVSCAVLQLSKLFAELDSPFGSFPGTFEYSRK
ncbi:MAG: Uma2 family endonuclease [Bryobacterales bacterium]|nr:Uma2 family endonuclease [Bryobacterales bacterium]